MLRVWFFAAIAALTSRKFKPASAMAAPTSTCVALGLAASQALILLLTSSIEYYLLTQIARPR